VRSDLQKIKGVYQIETDTKTNICKFSLANDEVDLKAKLDQFAKTNKHLAKWSFVEPAESAE
jgi:hypothetical protein